MEELWLPAVFRGVCLPFWVLVSLPCLLLRLCQLSWRLEDKILPPIRFQPGYRVVGTFLVMAANTVPFLFRYFRQELREQFLGSELKETGSTFGTVFLAL